MKKIYFLATDEQVKEKIEAALKKYAEPATAVPAQVHILDFKNLIRQGKNLVEQGAQVIVASGGTYQELSTAIKEIPVLRLYISRTDILFALNETGPYKKIYLLLNEIIAFDAASCPRDMQDKIEIRQYLSRSDIADILKAIKPQEDAVIVGSTVLTNMENLPLPVIPILPSETTIESIYQYAYDMASFNQRERKQISLLTTILSNVDEGIIIFDRQGTISHTNEKAVHFLHIPPQARKIEQLFPDMHSLKNPQGYFKEKILSYPPHTLVANAASFPMDNDTAYILTIRDVTELQKLENNVRFKLAKTGLHAKCQFSQILTKSPSMTALIETARTMAEYGAPVLIQGESGTGKEMFAQSLHNASPRHHGPFVAVNCAALPPELLESELFGYVGGSFTGARKEGKAGLFELAHNGTIFLDEINSMSPNIQSKLLRILETKEVMRIGSDYVLPLDIRIISASNGDILEEIAAGRFRRDLYFRLNTLTLSLPALDDRREDIVYLFKLFLERNSGRQLAGNTIPAALETALTGHHWWGNIRELQSVALRYHIFGDRNDPTYAYLFDREQKNTPHHLTDRDSLKIDMKTLQKSVEQLLIDDLLDQGWQKQEIAKALGISRQTLFNKTRNKT